MMMSNSLLRQKKVVWHHHTNQTARAACFLYMYVRMVWYIWYGMGYSMVLVVLPVLTTSTTTTPNLLLYHTTIAFVTI